MAYLELDIDESQLAFQLAHTQDDEQLVEFVLELAEEVGEFTFTKRLINALEEVRDRQIEEIG